MGIQPAVKVRVEYTAQLRAVAGCAEESVEVPEGSNLTQLLQLVANRQARDVASFLLTSAQELQPSLLIALNKAVVAPRDAHTVTITAGDVVTLLPPIAGG